MILIRFFWFLVFLMGVGAARSAGTGNVRAAIIVVVLLLLWNWRRVFDFVCERQWREWRR